ncbi:MAG: MotA/TolQ/ExbB proton channel family protein [Planctomycetota bacterium]|jgi:biopolymer transport protein ExbB
MFSILYLALLLGQSPETDSITEPAPAVAEGNPANEANEAGEAPVDDAAADTQEETAIEVEDAGEDDASIGVLDKLEEISQSGAIGFLNRGGVFMWPILLLGVLASGVIIERYRSLKLLTADSGTVRDDVLQMLREDRIEEAMQLCDREQGPVPAILSAGLRKFLILRRLNYDPAKVEEQVLKAMDDYGVHVVAALEKHLPVLATISSVAPMLGFLGTVAGMITSFDEIVAKMGETNIVEAAAGGISVALLTTAFGLIIGIPAFMAFNYFSSIINRFVLEIEESATHLIEAVTLQLALEKNST